MLDIEHSGKLIDVKTMQQTYEIIKFLPIKNYEQRLTAYPIAADTQNLSISSWPLIDKLKNRLLPL